MIPRAQNVGGVVVVDVEGDIDVSNTLVLRDALASAMGDGSARVMLDLSDVEFVDSAGVGLLVTAHRRAQQGRGAFAVASLTPTVARVLELTRTDRVLTVLPSVAEGIDALGGTTGDA